MKNEKQKNTDRVTFLRCVYIYIYIYIPLMPLASGRSTRKKSARALLMTSVTEQVVGDLGISFREARNFKNFRNVLAVHPWSNGT